MSSSQLCEYHVLGKCRFGNKCRNSHDLGAYLSRELLNIETHLSASPFPLTGSGIFQNGISALTAEFEGYQRQIESERAMKPILRQPDNAKVAIENAVKELSVAKETEKGISVEENANNLHVLDQKKMKENTEKTGAEWNNIILSAVDSNLLCNICFEIFIKPTVVNCSHTFCESCIHVWTLRVKNCPICRVEVKTKSYCLTLESFIEKIVEHLPIEIKNKREAAIKERSKKRNKRPRRANRRATSSALSGFMYMDRQAEVPIPPPQFEVEQSTNASPDSMLFNVVEMFRMNFDAVENRHVNLPATMPDFATSETYYTDTMHNPSARH